MKLKIGDKVYLQKYEIAYIVHNPNGAPGGLFNELFSGGSAEYFYMSSPEDGYQFKCVFKDPENVNWLMAQSWLVDFDTFSKMKLDDLEDSYERLRAEYRTSVEEYNSKDKEYRIVHYDEVWNSLDRLGHKVTSLNELIKYRKGKVKFVFPDEYRSKDTTANAKASTGKKKPGFFARLFSRSAQ